MALAHVVVTSDGVRIAVGDIGSVGGAGSAGRGTVVMAHATGFCGDVLGPVADHLGEAWRCVAFDERGHGASGSPPAGAAGVPGWRRWDWRGLAADVLAVVGWIDSPAPGHQVPVYGFGHSAGAAALLLAEIARPGTFAGIYAFEPVVFAPPPSGVLDLSSPLADMTRRRRESFGSREEAHANFLSKPPLSGFDPAALRAYLDHGFEELAGGEVRLRCGRNHEADMYMAGRAHDAWDHLGEIACPVTVAYGERSDFMDAASAGELASRLARGEVELVGGVSHFGPMERPGEVAGSAMAAFATGGPATGRRRVRDSDTPMA